jgi:23S rRNA U2552 (ribose-2'-O)-methylase RlmE/FtsJ
MPPSTKIDSYFHVYERVLGRFVDRKIVFVEVGVGDGGSLFMWRSYLGAEARIIGVDIDPSAKRLEDHGVEIFLGDQSNPAFWEEFYGKVGPVDVLLDDGGHNNCQQIVTAHHAIRKLTDGGVLLVEDVHTSYLKEYGNPSKYSFTNFAKHVVDSVNSRFEDISRAENGYWQRVASVEFFESIVVFNIDSTKCSVSRVVTGGPETANIIVGTAAPKEDTSSRKVGMAGLRNPVLRVARRAGVYVKSQQLRRYFR